MKNKCKGDLKIKLHSYLAQQLFRATTGIPKEISCASENGTVTPHLTWGLWRAEKISQMERSVEITFALVWAPSLGRKRQNITHAQTQGIVQLPVEQVVIIPIGKNKPGHFSPRVKNYIHRDLCCNTTMRCKQKL
jgi:hypothetical protein